MFSFNLKNWIPKNATKQISKLFTGKLLQYILGFTYGVAGTRLLGPSGFGKLVLIQSIVKMIKTPFDLNLRNPLTKLLRKFIENNQREDCYTLFGTALWIQWLSSICFAFVMLAFLYFGASFWSIFENWQTALGYFSMAEFLRLGRVHKHSSFLANEFYGFFTSSKIIKSFSRDILVIPFMFWGVTTTCFGFLISELVIYVLLLFLYLYRYGISRIKKTFTSVNFRKFGFKLYKNTRSQYVSTCFSNYFSSGQNLILGHLISSSAVSFFDISKKLNRILPFILGPVSNYLFPRLIEKWERDKEEFYYSLKKYFLIAGGTSIVIGSFLAIIAPWFYPFFYGPEFSRSAYIFWIILPGLVFRQTMIIFGRLTYVVNQMRQLYLKSILDFSVGLVLTVILVPFLQDYGAGIAFSATYIIVGVFQAYFFYGVFKNHNS